MAFAPSSQTGTGLRYDPREDRLLGVKGPSVSPYGVSRAYQGAGTMLSSAADSLAKLLGESRERQRMANVAGAVAKLGLPEPGERVSDWSTKGVNVLMAAGASPSEAMGIVKNRADRVIGERAAEAESSYKAGKLAIDAEKLAQPDYTTVKDDIGNIYALDKKTGSFKMIQEAPEGTVSPKNVQLVTVTDRDEYGNETTRVVPIDKRTGRPVSQGTTGVGGTEGEPGAGGTTVSRKRPAATQADRDAALAAKKAMDDIDQIETLKSGDIIGPVDSGIATAANTFGINSERAARNRVLNQVLQNLKANLTDALIKGVPSDRDMQVIEDMLPSVWDSEEVFEAKLKRIRGILDRQNELAKKQAEPRGQSEMYETEPRGSMTVDSGPKDAVEWSKDIDGKTIYRATDGKWYYAD